MGCLKTHIEWEPNLRLVYSNWASNMFQGGGGASSGGGSSSGNAGAAIGTMFANSPNDASTSWTNGGDGFFHSNTGHVGSGGSFYTNAEWAADSAMFDASVAGNQDLNSVTVTAGGDYSAAAQSITSDIYSRSPYGWYNQFDYVEAGWQSLSIVGGVFEVAAGAAGTVFTGGFSTALIVDGVSRITLNSIKLASTLNGEQNNLSGNLGGLTGQLIDSFNGHDPNKIGPAQKTGVLTNEILLIISPAKANAIKNLATNPSRTTILGATSSYTNSIHNAQNLQESNNP